MTQLSEVKKHTSEEKIKLEVTAQQADQLKWLFEFAKALAAPSRLNIIGILANNPKEPMLVADLIEKANIKSGSPQLTKELRQLAEAQIIIIEEERSPKPGSEPQPYAVRFNPEYLKIMPNVITTLHHLNSQLRPDTGENKVLDEKEKTLKTFFRNGQLTSWPVQFKRQQWVVEEVAKVFEANTAYTEREIDVILKHIYEHDHCTLRRYLVDLGFLSREQGIYRKV